MRNREVLSSITTPLTVAWALKVENTAMSAGILKGSQENNNLDNREKTVGDQLS